MRRSSSRNIFSLEMSYAFQEEEFKEIKVSRPSPLQGVNWP
jgi:hypothetical protein